MTQPVPIIMFGAAGRMGRMILSLAATKPDQFQIAGAIECSAHPLLGRSIKDWLAGVDLDLVLSDHAPQSLPPGTVSIHFAHPEATLAHLDYLKQHKLPAVIGTTGFNETQRLEIESAASSLPLLIASNTSRGVNVLNWLARQATRLLPDYDLEIIEVHHHHKKDAPSGTAKTLAQIVLSERKGNYEQDARHGRSGIVGARTQEEIGIHAVRAGDVIGDHTLILAGNSERIELTHRAHGRELFAWGALDAAAWLSGKGPGSYTMADVLGL